MNVSSSRPEVLSKLQARTSDFELESVTPVSGQSLSWPEMVYLFPAIGKGNLLLRKVIIKYRDDKVN